MGIKSPGENNLTQIFRLIEERYDYLKEQIEGCFYYVPCKLGATGFELDGVTYDEILAAYNDGKRIVGEVYVPSAAGLGVSGNFELPLSYLNDSNEFVLTMLSGLGSSEARIKSDGTIATYTYVLENTSGRITSISEYSGHTQYPSAKAVYDFVGGKKIVYSSSAPTTDDTSVMTIVL